MRDIFLFIGRIFSYIYSFSIHLHMQRIVTYIYTGWIKKAFKELGNNAYISRPIYLCGGRNVSIGRNFRCGQRLRLDAFDTFNGNRFLPKIIIGENVTIEKDCHIGAINKIVIGNGVLLASKVYISDHSHGEISSVDLLKLPLDRPLISKGPIFIEDNVWLGEGVVVLPDVVIGHDTIVGAGSVVTKSLPARVVAAGVPAKILKKL